MTCRTQKPEVRPRARASLFISSQHLSKNKGDLPCLYFSCQCALYVQMSRSRWSNSPKVQMKKRGGSFILMLTFFALGSLLSPLHTWTYLNNTVQQHQDTRMRSVNVRTSTNIDNTVAVVKVTDEEKENQAHLFGQSQTNALTFPVHQNTNFTGVLARSFEPWKHPLPCFKPDGEFRKNAYTPTNTGFLFVKPYKTGSSTTSGINLRIARNVAKRKGKSYKMCRARVDHGPWGHPAQKLFRHRKKPKSFLWTVIREPTKRLISQFFHFEVSRNNKEPTDEEFKKFIFGDLKAMFIDYYLQTLHTRSQYSRTKFNPVNVANAILEEYDFIGITERMDESAVLIMMLLDLPMSDILFLSAKGKGGYDDGGGLAGGLSCTYIWPSFVSPGMQNFFDTNEEWQSMVKYDLALYKAANASMDLTIDKLGRERFETNLAKFRHAQAVAQEKCLPTTIFPCDSGGRVRQDTDCLWKDSGCGVKCLDEIANELGLS